MKCPKCNKGELVKYQDKIEQDGIAFEAYKCQSCGEEIMNMDQLKELSVKYRKLKVSKEITFAKWGNSIALRIPKEIVNEYHIKSGKRALLSQEDNAIRITPT